MSYARTALLSVLIPLAGLLGTAVVNRLVDPYALFTHPASGDYAAYPRVHPNLRLHKAWQIRHRKPDTLVLGTSKAIQGIPMEHRTFEGASAYNLGVPLASMREIEALLDHARANGPVRRVLLLIDFLSFNLLARTDGPAAGFDPDRLDTPQRPAPHRGADLAASLLSLDALRASAATLIAGATDDHRVVTALGGRDDGDMLRRLADGGHRDNAIAIERFFTDTVYLPAPARRYALRTGETSAFAPFERLLRTAHEDGLQLQIVISPSHARLTELLHRAGLLDTLDCWKRSLVTLNRDVADAAGREPFPLLDASLPNGVTTEPFPPAGDTGTRMRGYYESVHFNQATGARLLDALSGGHGSNAHGSDRREGFAIELTGDTVTATLDAARDRLAAHAAAHPQDVDELRRTVDEVAPGTAALPAAVPAACRPH